MPIPISGTLGSQLQQQQASDSIAQHSIGNKLPSPSSGISKPQGGQNPANPNAGRAARNSAAAGASDASGDINHNAQPTPISEPTKTYGGETCGACAKRAKPKPGVWSQHDGFWWRPRHGRAAIPALPPRGQGDLVEVTGEEASLSLNDGKTRVHVDHRVATDQPYQVYQDSSPVTPTGLAVQGEHSYFVFSGNQTGSDFTVDYFYRDADASDPSEFLDIESYEDAADARDHALNFRGLVLWGQDETKVAALRAHYVSNGDIVRNQEKESTVEIVDSSPNPPGTQLPGTAVELEFEPVEPIELEDVDTNWGLESPMDNATEWFVQGNQLSQAVSPESGNPQVDYLVRLNFASSFQQFWYGVDGSTDTFYLKSGPTTYPTSLDDVDGPTVQIQDLIEVLVDGTPISGAVFLEDRVILPSPPAMGLDVAITVDIYDLESRWEELDCDGQTFEYSLDMSEEPSHVLMLNVFNEDVTEYATLDGSTLRTLRPFQVGNQLTVRYQREVNFGSQYVIDGLTIYEKDWETGQLRLLETPIIPYPANPIDPVSGIESRRSFPPLHYGYLFVDQATKSYSLVGPSGLMWRGRKKLDESLPAGVPFHLTLSAWPEESDSQDLVLAEPGRNRRPHPWLGVSVAGGYALQGSWNRVGGYRGDSDFPLRLWGRDPASKVWVNFQELSVTELCGDHSEAFPLRVCPSGMTDLFSVVTPGGGRNSTWPASRNLNAWLVAAGWIVHDFQEDWEGTPDPDVLGWEDAGFTINAVSCETGEVVASLTLRSDDEEAINQHVDPTALVEAELEAEITDGYLGTIIDKYYNQNPDYFPPNSGSIPAPPYAGQILWLADQRYGEYPVGGGYWWLFYKIASVADELVPTRHRPGLPSFASSPPRQWFNNSANDGGAENSQDSPDLVLDEDNNIYATLWMPCWLRLQDQFVGLPYETVEGEVTQSYGATTLHVPSYLISIPMGRLISNVSYSTFNGAPGEVYYPGFYSGIAELFTRVVFYRQGVYAGLDENDLDVWEYPALTVVVGWFATYPKVSIVTATDTFTPVAAFEYPSISGLQNSPQPYSGFKVLSYAPDRKPVYITTARQVLFKLHYDEQSQSLSEVWRKDISQMALTRGQPEEPERIATPYQGICHHTIAIGRYILVLREMRDSPESDTDFSRSLRLEAYRNGSNEPEMVHSVLLPNSDDSGIVHTVQMSADLDKGRREFALINFGRRLPGPIFQQIEERWSVLVHFDADLEEAPQVICEQQFDPSDTPYFPLAQDSDLDGLARAKGQFFWLDRQLKIWKRQPNP